MEDTCSAISAEYNNISEKEFLLQFISIYRDMPVLWRIKSKEYMNKIKRADAIKKMTELLKVSRLNLSEEEVKKRINILRTTFKRENNKIKKSMLSGCSTNEVYKPTLWYYKELEFLQDEIEEEPGISSLSGEKESSSKLPTSSQTSLPPSASSGAVRIKKKKNEDLQHDLMTLARDHFRKPENEYQVMARHWAFKLERMSEEQRRLAEKFINEILFEGEEGNLNRHSVVINPSQPELNLNTPSPTSYTPSPTSYTPSPIQYTRSPITQTPSRILHTEQPYLSNTEQPVIIHISDSQTNENNLTESEADTAAKFISNFYSF